jgi:hypothetical protein
MKLKVLLCTALVALAAIAGTTAATAAPKAAPVSANVAVPITGTIPSLTGTFNGTFNLQRFATQNGQIVAIGTLTGTLTNALGTVIGTVTNAPVTLPIGNASTGSCQILDLVLGPLDLNLLGLVVHLDTVHLNITAQQGPGNLLGNLLCAVAHLLDGNAAPNALTNLLNHILGAL